MRRSTYCPADGAILGVAAGWLREEFEALGLDFESRGKVLDESLDVLKAAWTESVPRFEGRFFNVSSVESYPHPVQSPHPPIWVGGHTAPGDAARREVRHGVVPAAVRHNAGVACGVSSAHQRGGGASRGRGENAVALSLRVLVDLRSAPDTAGAEKRNALAGEPERIAETLAGYADAGVSHFVFLPQARSLADVQAHGRPAHGEGHTAAAGARSYGMTQGDYQVGAIEVAPGVYAFIQPGGATDAGFIVEEEGVVIIDTLMTTTLAERLLAEVRRITDKPVRYVVNTHWHGDHLFGNALMPPSAYRCARYVPR